MMGGASKRAGGWSDIERRSALVHSAFQLSDAFTQGDEFTFDAPIAGVASPRHTYKECVLLGQLVHGEL